MRAALGLAAALALACTAPGGAGRRALPPVADGGGRPQHVVVVSIAGLTPDRYLAGDAMPLLTALAAEGVAAEHVEPVAPASAYPAHATLLTGVAPARHGIVADRLLGERGVRRTPPAHASLLRAPTLWQKVGEAGGAVVALDWPTTAGGRIASLLPDATVQRSGERWPALAAAGATPWIAERLPGAPAAAGAPGPARDAFLVDLACAAFAQRPRLLLLRLRGTEAPLLAGPYAAAAGAAFGAADAELARLLDCASEAGVLAEAAFVVAGDRAVAPVHTALRPNAWLREAGWITAQGRWKALARSNGRSAFVYAGEARLALQVRQRLERAAAETGAFRIVSAEEIIARGADPEAWFGLQAEPGFVFENGTGGPALRAATWRGAGGAFAAEDGPGLVAFGRGVRRGLRVPQMRQLDVAPTLAALLGVPLDAAEGRALVGLLRTAQPRAGAAPHAR
jgi:hypothetical protein